MSWITRLRQGAEWGLLVVFAGFSVLVVVAWIEVLNHPGASIVDGYWVGRQPWTSAGVVLMLAGSGGSLMAGTLAVAAAGSWWRRVLLPLPLGMAALWWAPALGLIPAPRMDGADPVGFAYSLPIPAAILLLVPAVAVTVMAVVAPRSWTRVTFSPPPAAPRAAPPPEEVEPDELEGDEREGSNS